MADQVALSADQLALSDEQLASLALAADPDGPIADDAVPIWDVLDSDRTAALLPDWYMPAPMARTRMVTGWRRRLAMLVIVAFLAVDAVGLCSTYGII